jgi:hypothetical protein
MKSLKTALLAASCLAAASYTGAVLAHSASGSLGSSSGATDVFLVTCSNEEGGSTPTYRLSSRVKDNSPVAAPIVSIVTSKGGTTTTRSDTNGDGNSSYSAWAYNIKGNGVYTVSVKKSAAGAENYTAQFHCESPASSGYIHTGTTVVRTQNQ